MADKPFVDGVRRRARNMDVEFLLFFFFSISVSILKKNFLAAETRKFSTRAHTITGTRHTRATNDHGDGGKHGALPAQTFCRVPLTSSPPPLLMSRMPFVDDSNGSRFSSPPPGGGRGEIFEITPQQRALSITTKHVCA